jgi:osmotically inducible protein OsmC
MALSMILGEAGFEPETISTDAEVTLEKSGEGFAITMVHLNVTAKVIGASDDEFLKAAEKAKDNCPVSKLFNTKITMEARLE